MSYIVFCTFDLANASRLDYQNAYADLEELGLSRIVVASNGNEVVIPTTSVIGKFNGESAANVRDDLRNRVKAAFSARGFDSEIFVLAAGDWTWGAATT